MRIGISIAAFFTLYSIQSQQDTQQEINSETHSEKMTQPRSIRQKLKEQSISSD
jgi:hypothetical protein